MALLSTFCGNRGSWFSFDLYMMPNIRCTRHDLCATLVSRNVRGPRAASLPHSYTLRPLVNVSKHTPQETAASFVMEGSFNNVVKDKQKQTPLQPNTLSTYSTTATTNTRALSQLKRRFYLIDCSLVVFGNGRLSATDKEDDASTRRNGKRTFTSLSLSC
jgi:hypothetical protein